MPVHKIQGGYQYGKTGKKYYGKDAKKKAQLQELAIRLSGYKEDNEKKKCRYLKHEADSESIGREFVSELFNDDQLEHHGIKGMHWGVWNADTRARYSGGRRHIRESTKKNVAPSRTSNVEKWGKDKKHNVLYVTGLSGSGKSTVAEGLRDSKTNVLHLDFFTNAGNTLYAKGHRDPEFVEHLKKEIPDYFDRYNGEFPELSKLSPEEKKAFWKTMDEFQDAIVSFGEKQYAKGKKVIAEGVQIADETLFVDKSFFKDQPLMILSTDKDTSLKRAAERDEIELNDEEAMKFRKIMQDNWSRQVNTLAQTADVKTGQIYVEQLLKKIA